MSGQRHYYVSDPLKDAIYQITLLVKRQRYDEAVALLSQHSLTLEDLSRRTFKLTTLDVARVADTLLNQRK